jgi:hypothetical protein
MPEIQVHRPRRSPESDRRSLHELLLPLVASIALSACTGIVIEPKDGANADGVTKFWGYAPTPGQAQHLEAQNTSGTWESLVVRNSVEQPTHAATTTGYYYEISYNPLTAPARFKRPGQFPGWTTVHFRVVSPGLPVAEIRCNGPLTTPPALESNLARAWAALDCGTVIHVNFQN